MLFFYAATLFVSAFLLFLVQPMVGKMILPALGGAPAVWNTCMVFFQAALLAGYAYAHGSIAWLGVRRQAALHLVLLLTPLLVLPIAMNLSGVPTAKDNPVFWLLGQLTLCVGLPFFMISTNAPLLQRWFSETGHAEARDPYFLYAASNFGSLVALLGYPLIVEPLLPVNAQSKTWAICYAIMVVMAMVCAIIMWRSPRAELEVASDGDADATEITARLTVGRRLRWILLAFVPSSLMLGVTTHITTEVAPVPLLWVVPLAIYLLSFVLVFARRKLLPHETMVRVFPVFAAMTGVMMVQNESSAGMLPLPLHLVTFFVAAMVSHGALAEDRPSARHLTQFYLLMSVGGVLGGIFNAIVAPLLFTSIAEYPIALVLACVALGRRFWQFAPKRGAWLDLTVPLLSVGLVAALLYLLAETTLWNGRLGIFSFLVPVAVCLLSARRPLRFAFTLAGVMLTIAVAGHLASFQYLYTGRNFYGVKQVQDIQGGQFHMFSHGTTNHGVQSTHPKGRLIPRTYYHPTGPLGDVFDMYNARPPQRPVAVIGLGVGSMAAYAQPGQDFVFYEIDPEVARIATDHELFTYLEDSKGDCSIVLGDGRLSLANAPDNTYGLLIIDAFSSDAIPTHLLTREAIALYFSKITPDGILLFHVSNRYINLGPLLASLAADSDAICLRGIDEADSPQAKDSGKFPSDYIALAHSERTLRPLAHKQRWKPLTPDKRTVVWTDQYSNLLPLLRFQQ